MKTPESRGSEIREHISAAALVIDGKLYTGKNHAAIISNIQESNPSFNIVDVKELVDGFVTNTGRFVDRYEAGEIADEADQIVDAPYDEDGELEPWEKGNELDSWDLKDFNYGDKGVDN